MKGQEALFSHKSDEYVTPQWLISEIKRDFDIRLDACTTEENPLEINSFMTKKDDGLKQDWINITYCNPPYSQAYDWVQKAFNENTFRLISSILLLPSRTDTRWFHKFIYQNPNADIRFLKGRLKFEGTEHPAPFPSMLVIFRNYLTYIEPQRSYK